MESNIRDTIADAVLNQRMALGLSQTELATRCGISQVYISQIETSDANPTIDIMQNILDKLGLTLSVRHQVREKAIP